MTKRPGNDARPGLRIRGSSEAFDARRLLEGNPDAERAATAAAAAAAAGELVRRLRTRMNMSQDELATRVGSTQAHISELERGLGTNGPTVTMLARIIRVLGDRFVVDTEQERHRREADQVLQAKSWAESVSEAMQRQIRENQRRTGLAALLRQWREAEQGDNLSLYQKMFIQGLLTGLSMAASGQALRSAGGRDALETDLRQSQQFFDTLVRSS